MGIKELSWNTHEEWLAIRHQYIGGSDAGAVIGVNPYKSAYTLWAEKTDRIPEFSGNLTTQVGAYLEDMVAHLFEDETEKKVRRKNKTMVNDLYPWACANVDRMIVGEKAFLEVKTTNSIPLMRQLRTSSEFPELYYCQCVHYLAVTGLDKCYLAVLINCRELKIYELLRDQAEIDALMQAEEQFWKLVQTNTPPAVDGSESTSESLKTIYHAADGLEVDLTPLALDIEELARIKAEIAQKTAEQKEKENEIKEYMKEAEVGFFGNYKVSFKEESKSGFDYKKLIADRPDMDFSAYKTVSTSRVFRFTQKKGKK